jgi:hypothetical protein
MSSLRKSARTAVIDVGGDGPMVLSLPDALAEIARLNAIVERKSARESAIAALTSEDTDEWCTPAWICALARQLSLTGRIGLDPCWNPRSLTEPGRWLTEREDGLSRSWRDIVHGWAVIDAPGDGLDVTGGLTYVNPPYSAMAAWVAKIRREAAAPLEILSLVKVATDTRWWSSLVWRSASAVAFLYKRLAHARNDGTGGPSVEVKGSTFASALVYHGFRADRFRELVAPHGAVVVLR